MEITERQHGAVLVLKPMGALTESDAQAFRERALLAAGKNLGRVVVDAAAIPYVDSCGLEALADVTEKLGEGGRVLKICGANQTIKRVLELTGWADSIECFDDTTAAVRSFL